MAKKRRETSPTDDAPTRSAGAPRSDPLPAALSLVLPGLGQAVRGRVVTALLFFLGVAVPYLFFLVLLNMRFGVRGELLSFSFDAARHPIRPPAEQWGLLLLGVALHVGAVWDAARRDAARNAPRV